MSMVTVTRMHGIHKVYPMYHILKIKIKINKSF